MTIKQARKILGEQAKGISDEKLEKEIEVAELLKSLFFSMVTNSHKTPHEPRLKSHNVP